MIISYFLIYFLLTFAIPSYRTYKKTGINPITFGKNDNAHDLIGFYMKVVMALIFVSALEASYFFTLNIPFVFDHPTIYLYGLGFMIVSLLWIILAQIQMSTSWRIGIDENHKTELKTSGLFRFSRNPIFLGMILSQFGFFLYFPTYLNLFILLVTWILISIQVRLEEEFLTKQHGEKYISFMKSTPRWIKRSFTFPS